MKQAEFKKIVLDYIEKKVEKYSIRLSHFNIPIFLKVEHPTNTPSLHDIDVVFQIYIDNKKKRVFFVGKSEQLQQGIIFKKYPLEVKFNKFIKWLTKSDKYDEYEMYFAWNYNLKDESVYDYIALDKKVNASPKIENLDSLIFYTVDDLKAYQLKVKNLHENKIFISYLNDEKIDN